MNAPLHGCNGYEEYVSPEEAQRRLAELKALPAVPRQQRGIPNIGMIARRIARSRRSRAETRERWRTRRTLAATYPIPPAMAAHLTTSEMAYCRLVANEVMAKGTFDLSHHEAAQRCRMHPKTAQRAQARLQELGWIWIIKCRDPQRPRHYLPNVVRIVSKEWLSWIARSRWSSVSHRGHSSPSPENIDSNRGPNTRATPQIIGPARYQTPKAYASG
jgi:hypothetical protein